MDRSSKPNGLGNALFVQTVAFQADWWKSLNKILIILLLVTTISLQVVRSFAISEINDEIEVIPPLNWKPSPSNNSTSVIWFQNSTKSVFAIIKAPDKLTYPLILAGPFMTTYLKYKGLLESSDQLEFGQNNHGFRYFLNLSSPSKLLDSSSGLIPANDFLKEIPVGYDIPYKGILILTEKHRELYAIIFLSPQHNFDSALNEIKPTLDSIRLTVYTKMQN